MLIVATAVSGRVGQEVMAASTVSSDAEERTRRCVAVQPVVLVASRDRSTIMAVVASRDAPEAEEVVEDRRPGGGCDVESPAACLVRGYRGQRDIEPVAP